MPTLYTHVASNRRKTVVLLGTFLVLVIGLGWVFARAYESPLILYLAVIIAVAQAWISYYYSDKITLAISQARKVEKRDHPELYRLLENLAITAGLPVPALYIIDDPAPNAFATGRNPQRAAVAVTTGLLRTLDRDELSGVLAHELAHIGNRDTLVMTVVVTLVGVVALLSDMFLRLGFYGSGRRREGGGVIALVALMLALLSPLIATLIQLAISRKREFLADATGALLTRYPEGLARALEKIARDHHPLAVATKATAHLYIVNPLREHQGKDAIGWFATRATAVAERGVTRQSDDTPRVSIRRRVEQQ
jgi:heat shock protein HtpX